MPLGQQEFNMKTLTTKKGAASLYVVIFATMLFSVVTVSFARLMIAEIERSSEDELSQSAYDSALVGIEDAKEALMQCLSSGKKMQECFVNYQDCNFFADTLNRSTSPEDGSVIIQTTEENGDVEAQSYTCVTMDNEVDSYMSYLNASNTMRVIPIDNAASVKIEWGPNDSSTTVKKFPSLFPTSQDINEPPVVAATFVRTNQTGSTLVFLPSNSGSKTNFNDNDLNYTKIGRDNTNQQNPYEINCNNKDSEFLCSVVIDSTNLKYIALSLPYGDKSTNFSVTKYDAKGDSVKFVDVLYKIDSTGRANDLLRRVEAYIDTTDQYFPYPEYAVSSGDDNNSTAAGFSKSFYVTTHCWRADYGSVSSCSNYGDI